MLAVSQQQGGAEKILGVSNDGASPVDANVPGEHHGTNPVELQHEITTQDGNYLQQNATDFQPQKHYDDTIDPLRQETNCSPDNLQIDLSYAVESTYDHLRRNQIYNNEFACNSSSANTLVVQQPTASDESVASSHSSYSGNIQVVASLKSGLMICFK